VPFRNPFPLGVLPDFPSIVPSWTRFGATAAGISGSASLAIPARAQSTVAVTLQGPTALFLPPVDAAGGVQQSYRLTWTNIVPDPGSFSWSVTGAGQDGGPIALDPMSFGGVISVNLPLPWSVATGTHDFKLTVTATETRTGDPMKSLIGPTSIDVRVHVLRAIDRLDQVPTIHR
jgi:hypothetical protein